jgi:integrase
VVRSGVQQQEIPELTIDDLIRNASSKIAKIRASGPGGPTYVDVGIELRDLLEEYLKYLDSHYKNNSKLFPKYNQRECINKSFNAYKKQLILAITFHDLRKFGIKRHYENLRNRGMSEKDSLEATGKQFRISPEEVSDSIHGNIKSTGKKP